MVTAIDKIQSLKDEPGDLRSGSCHHQKDARYLEVCVLYTNVRSTLDALRTAASLACGLAARIRLLVPHVVPYPLPLDKPPVAPAVFSRHFKTISGDVHIETTVDVRLCRDRWEAVRQALRPRSLVVIGGKHRWWPTAERRMSAKLRKEGHQVVFSESK